MKRNTFIAMIALVAVVITARFVEAQFVPPTSGPPMGGPTVVHDIALSATPQPDVSVNVEDGIRTNGCMGSTFVGRTATSYHGNRGGYKATDALCDAVVAGSHVCRVEEVMESVKCAVPLTVGQGWVNGGPPGHTSNANDCGGWTSNNIPSPGPGNTFYGRVWVFDNGTTGGSGAMTTCGASLPFNCCK